MIEVSELSKSYGPIQALKGVSFHVAPGQVIGLLGPNGAGKTTVMKILTGYLQADSGRAIVDGMDVFTDTLEVQKRIGYLPENAPLYPELSVQAYLGVVAELRQVPVAERSERLSEAVRATGLAEHLTRPIGQLSKGYRQRVGLAQAILHEPKLLILDEPTVGLDPTQIAEVRRLIRRLAEHSTVLLSTHILSEVEATCDGVIILLNGEVRADARLAELAATMDVVLVLGEGARSIARDLEALPGVRAVDVTRTADGQEYRVFGEDLDLRPAIYDLARKGNWPLRELRRDARTLESIFSELATAAGKPGAVKGAKAQ